MVRTIPNSKGISMWPGMEITQPWGTWTPQKWVEKNLQKSEENRRGVPFQSSAARLREATPNVERLKIC